MDNIGVVGTSYRTTDVTSLAEASLPGDFADEHLVDLAHLAGFSELVYLGTCNRVEFYFCGETRIHTNPLLFHLRRSLMDLTDGACQLPDNDRLYVHFGPAAARHLFRVTSALDSMMVGEAQITGQSKEAHERSHNLGLLGGALDQTFHEAFHVAKRVRSETQLARRPVSLVTLVERLLHDHLESSAAPVLIVGAGDMARQTIRLIRIADAERVILVANRTRGRADELVAGDPAARAVSLTEIYDRPPEVGAIVAATSSDDVVVDRGLLSAVRARLADSEQLLLVDLAMPPNIDPIARTIDGVVLHGIEEMREEAEINRGRRLAEMDSCEALVEHQLETLRRRLLDRAISPVAQTLQRSFQEMADRSVQHALTRKLAHLADSDRQAVEEMAQDLVKRLIQVPLRGLKGAAWNHSSAVISNFIDGLDSNNGSGRRENGDGG